MVSITKQDDNFVFEVKGMHKLWAFKSELVIPAEHILSAHQGFRDMNEWKGWRAPGTNIPFLVTAGNFYIDGNKIFWDVSDQEKSIVVNLKDEDYKQLIIEVENPGEAINLLAS